MCIVHDQHNLNDLSAPGLFYSSATCVSAFYLEPIVIFPKMTKLHSFVSMKMLTQFTVQYRVFTISSAYSNRAYLNYFFPCLSSVLIFTISFQCFWHFDLQELAVHQLYVLDILESSIWLLYLPMCFLSGVRASRTFES